MKNYKAMKDAKSWSVKKAKVVTREAVSEVKDDDGKVVKEAVAEESKNELQLVQKRFDASTGKAMDDSVMTYDLNMVANDITRIKADIANMQSELADMELLETDLKAL
tara:strand:- start:1507 stop:1830 length:324 start_codon:yes stop_codon:yes gene_type:complete